MRSISWAIWNGNDLTDTTVIRENLADLKTSVVMVALNISARYPVSGETFTVAIMRGNLCMHSIKVRIAAPT